MERQGTSPVTGLANAIADYAFKVWEKRSDMLTELQPYLAVVERVDPFMAEHAKVFNSDTATGRDWRLALEEVGLRAMSGEAPTIDTIQSRVKEAAAGVISAMEHSVGMKGGFALLERPFETLALLILMGRIEKPNQT